MEEGKRRKTLAERPIEQHHSAAWANIEKLKAESQVQIPDDDEVINAKEYVDDNEK